MPIEMRVGRDTRAGVKPVNQDFEGIAIPSPPLRATKGVAFAVADGIGSSTVSGEASKAAVDGFLQDYFSTPETWTVPQSAHRVLAALNAWLYARTRQSQFRYSLEQGYVTTFCGVVVHGSQAHVFHIGDSRAYHLDTKGELALLTEDHRRWLSAAESQLSRALGFSPSVEIGYRQCPLNPGDRLILVTDGVSDTLELDRVLQSVHSEPEPEPEWQATMLVAEALGRGSQDNLTAQVICLDQLDRNVDSDEPYPNWSRGGSPLPAPPPLHEGLTLDGWTVGRCLHTTSRSHVFWAVNRSGEQAALKVPSAEQSEQQTAIQQLAMERWALQRVAHPNIVQSLNTSEPQRHAWLATAYLEGCSLRQWSLDHRYPPLDTVRAWIIPLVSALRALHRQGMTHCDIRPENVWIGPDGKVTLIDLGAVYVEGVGYAVSEPGLNMPQGAALFSAPETFLNDKPDWRSDQFSLAVLVYHLLTGSLPYGTDLPKCRSRTAQRRLRYQPVTHYRDDLPDWLDTTLARALHVDPLRRYPALSEFLQHLHEPDPQYQRNRPLMERDPITFWQGLSALLLFALLLSLAL